MQRSAILAVLAVGVACAQSSGPQQPKRHYVANSGDDSGPGTEAAPWRTLGRLANLTLSPGDAIYLKSGDIWTEQLALGGGAGLGLAGCMDKETHCAAGKCSFVGWAVDCGDSVNHGASGCHKPNHSAPLPSIKVSVLVDGKVVATALANGPRPDLVAAGAAPDPLHGFSITFELEPAYRTGEHRIAVEPLDAGWAIPLAQSCLCDGALCDCKPPKPGSGPPAPPPVLITSTDLSGPRPIIRLDGTKTALDDSQWAIQTKGLAWITIKGVAIEHATSGISVEANDPSMDGAVEITDCIFSGVWNRSSVGQRWPTAPNQCSNGWSPCVMAGGVTSVTVSNCLFNDFDVAFQPSGTIGKARFTGNTLTGGNGNCVFFVASHDWLLSGNIFSRDTAPRYFTCGTTDIMIGGACATVSCQLLQV